MDEMDDLKVIVDKLNAPPFNKQLTMVALHKKTPIELLQVVNDVVGCVHVCV